MKIMTNNGFMTKVMGLAKGVLPFYLFTLLPFCASAQISKHVTVDSVGQLAKQIDNEEKFKISSLSVSGPLNSADVKLLQQIVNRAKASEKKGECVVTSVDLSGAVFTEGKEAKATTTLPNGLFSGAKQLVKVILPQGITAISKSCFDGCSSLPDIQIPSSVTVEEDDGDGNVTEVTYPVTAIGEDAFYDMDGIESVTIPASVTNIYDWAFEDCFGLTNVVFAGGMASVHMSIANAFRGTPWLEAYLATLPAPDNDDFANATMISGASGSVTGTNLGASVEEDEPLSLEPDFESTATVWWRWTAPTNGTFAFSTRGSNFDTVLGVYTGSAVDELEEVASNDDSFGSTSAVSFDAVMGTTYYFAVGGYEEAAGSIILSWGVDDVIVDAGGGKTVAVPGSWLEEFDTLWDDYDGDKTAYVHSTAVNGRKVWECYVLDLDPELDDDFTIVSFPMNADGTPDLENIEYYPPQEDWNVSAQPIVKGAATLDGEWQTVTEQNKSSLRFFKVEVVLP